MRVGSILVAFLLLLSGCHNLCQPEQLPPIIVKPPPPPARSRPDLRTKKLPETAADSETIKSLTQDLEDVIGYSETLEEDLKAYK